jgi:aspartyl-tRNA(Asn)/glutamyl-tRNA(Gln) amidotransferase subunit A
MLSIKDLQDELASGKTPTHLVEEAISRLQNSTQYNAVISPLYEEAKSRAKQLEASGQKGRLYGIPFIAKDNFLITGSITTAASNILGNFKAPYTATAIKKLEDEGAICIAKANMDAFGHGSSTENSDFAPTLNPHDQTKVPGGSSGGSAAAVALGIVPFSICTDTGGSIRQPASFCGVVGLKPSYGAVSRNGVIAMASSTDCIGPVASTVQDASLILDIISGKDPKDSTTIDKPGLNAPQEATKFKVAVIKELMVEGLDSEVRTQVLRSVEHLKKSGIEVEEISIPEIEYALAAYYIIVPAEISSNLARYDGIRYGYRTEDAKDLNQNYEKTRQEGFNSENKRRILIGTYVLSSGYYDAYYKKAQQVRTLLKEAFNKAFQNYDCLLGPVAPSTAFTVGGNSESPLQMYLGDIMTVAPSLIGSPALSVPIGLGSGSKMPVGLQIIGSHTSDAKILALAQLIEEAQL